MIHFVVILSSHGFGATGMARTNSGINQELVDDKNNDGKVKKMYEFNTVKAIPTPDNQVLSTDLRHFSLRNPY